MYNTSATVSLNNGAGAQRLNMVLSEYSILLRTLESQRDIYAEHSSVHKKIFPHLCADADNDLSSHVHTTTDEPAGGFTEN